MRSKYSRRIYFEALETRYILAAPAGDYDDNGFVDPPDYGVWRGSFGVIGTSPADGNANGVVNAADYVVWRKNLGGSSGQPHVNISIDTLSEMTEVNPGAIIWRNSDFSKESLASTQPEPSLPKYVADYLAPSTLYDPNSAADFTDAVVNIDPTMIGQYTVKFTFDTAKLRLWTTTAWTGMTNVGSGRYQIPSGVTLTPNTGSIDFQIEGLVNSAAFATDSILVQAIPDAGGATLSDTGIYTVVDTGIGVDGNRDTAIDFTNSHDRELLFWFNNDQEGFHESDTTIESEKPNITAADNTNNLIGQRRDLEDLAPLRVNAPQLLVQNAFDTAQAGAPDPGQLRVTYRINLVNPAGATIRLFYSNNDQEDVILHVSDDTTADTQATDSFFRTQAGPSFATTQQLQQITAGDNAFLFEAIGANYGSSFTATPTLQFETEIQYADGSTTSKIQPVELDLRDVKQFYTRWDVDYGVTNGQTGTDTRTDVSFQNFATPTTPTHASQITEIPYLSGPDTIVYAHGWNNSDVPGSDDKAAGAETMFKRLYWQGFRGEFVAFNWPTFFPEGPLGATYNPSEFQAYRSANALMEILADYRGEFPDLQPVHLLAHSMGNIVAGEALRLWSFDPDTEDPLVTNYVAMQAAVSAGAYGSNGTDSRFPGRPEPDLYRFWSHGQQDGLTNPNLGTSYYFQGAGFGAEQRINMFNEDDYALDLWDVNNVAKEAVDEFFDPFEDPYYYWEGWPYGYLWRSGPDRDSNTNDDSFERYNPNETFNAFLTLTNPQGHPGVNAYEIMAFFAQSADTALGTKSVTQFDVNIDIQSFGLLGGDDIRANHSYQLNHDAAETWDFYARLKTELQFGATYSPPPPPASIIASIEPPRLDGESNEFVSLGATKSQERFEWFPQPAGVFSREERRCIKEPGADAETSSLTLSRSALLDAYYERYEEGDRYEELDRRWAAKRPKGEELETSQTVWEFLGLGESDESLVQVLS